MDVQKGPGIPCHLWLRAVVVVVAFVFALYSYMVNFDSTNLKKSESLCATLCVPVACRLRHDVVNMTVYPYIFPVDRPDKFMPVAQKYRKWTPGAQDCYHDEFGNLALETASCPCPNYRALHIVIVFLMTCGGISCCLWCCECCLRKIKRE